MIDVVEKMPDYHHTGFPADLAGRWYTFWIALWMLVLCLSCAPSLMAEELDVLEQTATPAPIPGDDDEQNDAGLISRGQSIMEGTREMVGRNVKVIASELDTWFSGEEEDAVDLVNGSYVRIRFSEIFEKYGKTYTKQKVKLKLDLPNTERRLKIIFESDPDDTDSLEEKNRELESEEVRLNDDSSSAGALRFLFAETQNWKVNFDIGVRSTPLDPFARMKIKRKGQLTEYWRFQFKQYFYFYDNDGWGETSTLTFIRPLSENVFFTNKMEAQFKDEDNLFEFAEVASIFHRIDDKHSMRYAVGVIGDNRPVPRTTSYFFRTVYRYRLYRDWIYFNVEPDISFPREERFSLFPSLTLRLEFIMKEQ